MQVRRNRTLNNRKLLFNSLVRPHLDYCSVVYHQHENWTNTELWNACDIGKISSSSPLRDQLGWTTLHERRQRFMLTQVHKCLNLAPDEQVQAQLISVHWIRKHHLGQPKSEHYRRSFEYSGALHYMYNRLPLTSKLCPTTKSFKTSHKPLIE